MCHVLCVTCHTSRVTCHLSPVTCNFFLYIIFLLKRWWSSSVEGLLSTGPTPSSFSNANSLCAPVIKVFKFWKFQAEVLRKPHLNNTAQPDKDRAVQVVNKFVLNRVAGKQKRNHKTFKCYATFFWWGMDIVNWKYSPIPGEKERAQLFQPLGEKLSYYNGKGFLSHHFGFKRSRKLKF